eukprot:TRINITY_DN40465_c0_g1_i1.p1 TRINITY_DN40465_c0_g1~~TRINITY_DN40465_c0_g1_i1.p1  ORF type:complete len:108 (+),score=20.23 TRINITY_DN40465_c0_g1_i1:3-326(+)
MSVRGEVLIVYMSCYFFFFKQKTAYEMLRSLVGSEMCIRDSAQTLHLALEEGVRADRAGASGRPLTGVDVLARGGACMAAKASSRHVRAMPTAVSYTHLTLPTKRIV